MKKIIVVLLLLGAMAALNGVLNEEALAKDPMSDTILEGLTGEPNGAAPALPPMTVTYDVWISPTAPPIGPPYPPFHDCLTLDYDGANWTMLLEGCPPAGPANVGPGNLNIFSGVACSSIVLGWFLNGTPYGWNGDVIGGVMVRPPKTWGLEGVRNDDCQP